MYEKIRNVQFEIEHPDYEGYFKIEGVVPKDYCYFTAVFSHELINVEDYTHCTRSLLTIDQKSKVAGHPFYSYKTTAPLKVGDIVICSKYDKPMHVVKVKNTRYNILSNGSPLLPHNISVYSNPSKKGKAYYDELLKKVAIHCPTKEEAKKILNIGHVLGYAWSNYSSYLTTHEWDRYQGKTCYLISEGHYGPLHYFEDRNYKIITPSEFLELINSDPSTVPSTEEEPSTQSFSTLEEELEDFFNTHAIETTITNDKGTNGVEILRFLESEGIPNKASYLGSSPFITYFYKANTGSAATIVAARKNSLPESKTPITLERAQQKVASIKEKYSKLGNSETIKNLETPKKISARYFIENYAIQSNGTDGKEIIKFFESLEVKNVRSLSGEASSGTAYYMEHNTVTGAPVIRSSYTFTVPKKLAIVFLEEAKKLLNTLTTKKSETLEASDTMIISKETFLSKYGIRANGINGIKIIKFFTFLGVRNEYGFSGASTSNTVYYASRTDEEETLCLKATPVTSLRNKYKFVSLEEAMLKLGIEEKDLKEKEEKVKPQTNSTTSVETKPNQTINKSIKKENNMKKIANTMMEKYKSQFFPTKQEGLRISINGEVCVKVEDGYNAITAEKEVIQYPSEMTLDIPVYTISKKQADVKIGDIILHTKYNFAKVVSISKTGQLTVLTYTGVQSNKKIIKDFLFGQALIPVVFNMFGETGMGNTGVNPMMLMAMSGEGDVDMKDMMMMSMMSGGNGLFGQSEMGGMNPMMMMMLLDKEGGKESSMMETMMMMSMMGGNNPFGIK